MRKHVSIMALCLIAGITSTEEPYSISGIYPHLGMYNSQGECGTGAVVPWAGSLWVVTYSPHAPRGSDDKLYQIDVDLKQTIRPESIGGTPANRMIHTESKQLFIGPYAVDKEGTVRAISYSNMPGRPTGTARHLTDPENKVYYATMEEGFYEVDVHSLSVTELYPDGNSMKEIGNPLLPGYHGKGLYSGQGRLIYANNGEHSKQAQRKPDVPSGCLAEWNGKDWRVVQRNQFTEVTGPGGIYGSDPEAPVWSIGWDHRSLILKLLDGGAWYTYRLPKASHCYDGAHGWNTEWPRIREIGEDNLLMTMHGMFWRFPKTFSTANSAGIAPRSTYLKVIGDFCRWEDRVVMGCDDTAKSEFLNKRKAKGDIAGPGQSHSNLWFVNPEQLDQFGPALGRGAVWLDEAVKKGVPSEPYLFSGFARRGVHLAHDHKKAVTFTFEVDRLGNGVWEKLRDVKVSKAGYQWVVFTEAEQGQWIRVRANRDCENATVFFQYANEDHRLMEAAAVFDGLARPDEKNLSGGLVYARGMNKGTLFFASSTAENGMISSEGLYELNAKMQLKLVESPHKHRWVKENIAIPTGVLHADDASVIYVNEKGQRYRLPFGNRALNEAGPLGPVRVDREVVTERDLFNSYGIFYELPALNAGGFAKIRPITTHNRYIKDYCSWRGLLVMTGIAAKNLDENPHIIRSRDGKTAVWVGAVDDLWKLGKPRGQGGPWKDTPVHAEQLSDPYLMTGFDKKSVTLSHNSTSAVNFALEVDITGTGHWQGYDTVSVMPEEKWTYSFPAEFQAYWIRCRASAACIASAQFRYE